MLKNWLKDVNISLLNTTLTKISHKIFFLIIQVIFILKPINLWTNHIFYPIIFCIQSKLILNTWNLKISKQTRNQNTSKTNSFIRKLYLKCDTISKSKSGNFEKAWIEISKTAFALAIKGRLNPRSVYIFAFTSAIKRGYRVFSPANFGMILLWVHT